MTDSRVSIQGVALLVVLFLCGIGHPGFAQSHEGDGSIDVEEISLGRALEQLAATTGMSLVYDFTLVEGRQTSCSVENVDPSTLLKCLLEGHPIDYVQTSKGTYVLREAVRESPAWGEVTGFVRDGERGVPLPYAHIRLPQADPVRGTVSDSTGHFQLPKLPPGAHTLVVTRIGYRRHEATLYVPPDGSVHHEATLTPAPIRADSVIVGSDRNGLAGSQRGGDQVSAGQLLQVGVAQTPDVLTAASSLLGVNTSAPYADLHIQGSDTRGHTLRLDGVPIRNPVSMGRLLGAFSPLALDGVTAYKAGFGVLHGNTRSGTIELEHDLSDRGARYGSLRIDPRSVDARLRGTTSLGETPVTAMVAGRMSVWDVYRDASLHDLIDRWSTLDPVLASAQSPADSLLTGGLGARTKPNAGFFDVHGAARFEFGSLEHLYVSAYHGGSHLGADLLLGQAPERSGTDLADMSPNRSAVTVPTHDEYAWTNTAAQIRYERPVTGRTMGTVQASVSHYQSVTRSEVGPLESQASDEFSTSAVRAAAYGQEGANEMMEVALDGRLDAAFTPRSGLTVTAGAIVQDSRFRIGNAFAPRLRHRGESIRLTTATEATVGLGSHTTLEGGVRLTSLPSQGRIFAEPRGAVRYEHSAETLGTIGVRVGGGLYRQFTSQYELSRDGATAVVPSTHLWLPVTASLTPSRTYQLAASATWHPSPRWQVNLEGYRKWQPHLLALDYPALRASPVQVGDTPPPSHVLGSSRGRAYGGGLQVEYDGPSIAGSVRYAYSQARRTFPGRFDGRLTPVPWIEPHRVSLRADVPLGAGVAFEVKGEGVWGRRWGYRRSYYAYLTPADLGGAWNRVDLNRPGTHVLSPLYQLDTGLSLTQSWNGLEVKGRLGIANVLNRDNVADWALQPHEDGSVTQWARTLPGRRATVSIQVRY